MSHSLTGKVIGKYRILEKIGGGGMAEVYLGYQENLDRRVAIKFMHTFLAIEPEFNQSFQREARAMASMSHPNIVSVYDFDIYGENTYYIVMEYINGGTLKEKLSMLEEQNWLPLKDAIRIVAEVADALAYAHSRNIVNRDIKPANIMLDKETGKAILTDFGLVKFVGNQSMASSIPGGISGTPAYMSPEQALGKPVDGRSDIYSLGVVLFHLVTTMRPYDSETPLAVVMKHVNTPLPLPTQFNQEIPLALQEIILKMTKKDPDDRLFPASEVAKALRAVDLKGVGVVSSVNKHSDKLIMPKHESEEQVDLTQLPKILTNYFSIGELKTLCFDLAVDYESLPGEAKTDKARELVSYLKRRDQTMRLLEYFREARPNIVLPTAPASILPNNLSRDSKTNPIWTKRNFMYYGLIPFVIAASTLLIAALIIVVTNIVIGWEIITIAITIFLLTFTLAAFLQFIRR